jgi:hypothetical protein
MFLSRALNVVCSRENLRHLSSSAAPRTLFRLFLVILFAAAAVEGETNPNVRRVVFLALCPRPKHTTINNPARAPLPPRASRPLKGCQILLPGPNYLAS